MHSFVYTTDEQEIAGDTFTLTAALTFDVTAEDSYSADVGGVDGWEIVTFELTGAKLDGFTMTRSMLLEALGAECVKRIEAFELDAAESNMTVVELMEAA